MLGTKVSQHRRCVIIICQLLVTNNTLDLKHRQYKHTYEYKKGPGYQWNKAQYLAYLPTLFGEIKWKYSHILDRPLFATDSMLLQYSQITNSKPTPTQPTSARPVSGRFKDLNQSCGRA